MSWTDIWVLLQISIILALILSILFKKTRVLGFSLIPAAILYYIGINVIQYYTVGNAYKNTEYVFKRPDTVNILPGAWLIKPDRDWESYIIPQSQLKRLGIYFPLGSAPNLSTLYCSEDDGYIVFDADRFGFRNADSAWNRRDHDFLLLGDSFAEGACVARDIASQLNDRGLHGVTLGKGGNGPLISHAALREYFAAGYHADAIINLIIANDYSRPRIDNLLTDFEREYDDPLLSAYLKDPRFSQAFFRSDHLRKFEDFGRDFGSETEIIRNSLAELTGYELIRGLASQSKNSSKDPSPEIRYLNDRTSRLLANVYKSNDDLAKQNNAVVINLILPDKQCLHNSRPDLWISDLLKSRGIKSLNLHDALCRSHLFAKKGSHLNQDGYGVLSQYIHRLLIRRTNGALPQVDDRRRGRT